MREFIELIASVGIPVKNMDMLDIFTVSGRIIKDREIHKRKVAIVQATGNCVLPYDADKQIIAAMTPEEKSALRIRAQR
jgi:formylmethanofuran dehydrogenase subunit A